MNKYLTLAALLGAIAFVSVSFLAQAEPETGAVTTAVEAAASEAVPVAADMTAAPVEDTLAKDTEECTAAASAKKEDGSEPTAEEKDAAVKKCLEDKGHKAAEEAAEGAAEGAEEHMEEKAAE